MTPYLCDGAVIERCYACQGLWFDHKEIGVFKRSLDRFDLSRLRILEHPPRPHGYQVALCPRCEEVLVESSYGYNTDVRVHRCLKCQGLWLPVHEMVGFVELTQNGQALAPHIRGFLKEHAAYESENRYYRWLYRLGRWMVQPWDPWTFFGR
jgi:Zn-finger nucleic acid-binding protein